MASFYSNGKLLITGEYLVLDGATAFAVPTKFGQNLAVLKVESNSISWKSYDCDGSCWFQSEITFDEVYQNKSADQNNKIKSTLLQILHEAHQLNSNLILNSTGFEVQTTLTFPRNWGLGTSSTLINNIAQWFQVDAFTLLKNSFGGSGYDIACAQNATPILYQLKNNLPFITPIQFAPEFTKNIYFVYLNQKQNSKTAIENYRKTKFNKTDAIQKIDQITKVICTTKDFSVFEDALKIHESEMAILLNQTTIQQQMFSDFPGTIKSLGAWGGDFVLVLSKENPNNYFKLKGFTTVLTYADMIL